MSTPPKSTEIPSTTPTAAPAPPATSSIVPKIVFVGVLVTGLCYALYLYNRSFHHISTDDAFVEGRVTNISAKISNQVVRLAVNDNQVVNEGDLLLQLDPGDYQAALEEAQANSTKANSDLERTKALKNSSSVSQADLDAAIAAQGVDDARLKQAKLNLEYATLKATVPGRITRRTVEVGNYVQNGQTLLSIVQPDRWVIANFKETQLANMEPNQKVNIYVDSLGITLHGHIDSFQPGTGARFSLLPAENATGNYVKVVQRVPVKILIDEPPETLEKLAPGLSVQPEVEIP